MKKCVIACHMTGKSYFHYTVLTLFFVSGLCGLSYEVLWMSLLKLIFGSAMPAVTTILASLMSGFAIGSFIGGKLADRIKNQLRFYALLELFIGLYGLFFIFLYHLAADIYTSDILYFIKIIFIVVLLLVLSIFMGATFPVIVRFFSPDFKNFKRNVSFIYFVNAAGGAAGALFTGVILID